MLDTRHRIHATALLAFALVGFVCRGRRGCTDDQGGCRYPEQRALELPGSVHQLPQLRGVVASGDHARRDGELDVDTAQVARNARTPRAVGAIRPPVLVCGGLDRLDHPGPPLRH